MGGIIYSLISKISVLNSLINQCNSLGLYVSSEKYDGKNEYGLADAHFSYAKRIPSVIEGI